MWHTVAFRHSLAFTSAGVVVGVVAGWPFVVELIITTVVVFA